MAKVYGADVSHHQGPNLDFGAMKRSGVEYCWVKANQGTYMEDAQYHNNIRKGKAAGVIMGAYHFCEQDPGRASVAGSIAKFKAKVMPTLQAGDLLPALDIEMQGWNAAKVKAYRVEFEKQFGFTPAVYIATSIYQQSGVAAALQGCPLWIPRYNTSPPVIPWDVWQYTDKRPAPGTGGIDGNVTERLEKMRYRPAGAPPPAPAPTPPAPTPPEDEDMAFTDEDRALLRKATAVAPVYVRDTGNSKGAVYVIGDAGGYRRWISNGAHLANLTRRFGIQVEDWDHADVIDVPLVGPAPPE